MNDGKSLGMLGRENAEQCRVRFRRARLQTPPATTGMAHRPGTRVARGKYPEMALHVNQPDKGPEIGGRNSEVSEETGLPRDRDRVRKEKNSKAQRAER